MFSCMCLWLAAIQSWGENLNGNNFIVSEKRIALRMLLKTSSIEEGTSFVTFFFVMRCVSNFLCFSICFLLFQRAFTFLTPPPQHPPSLHFLIPGSHPSLHLPTHPSPIHSYTHPPMDTWLASTVTALAHSSAINTKHTSAHIFTWTRFHGSCVSAARRGIAGSHGKPS